MALFDQVKDSLDIDDDDTSNDAELQDMLDGAEAEYVQYVGSLDSMPANHALTVVVDVAELWARTQRGPNTGRPGFGGEGVESEPVRPLVLFPRIRALGTGGRQPLGSFPDAQDWPCS